ncbi:hypothetical protein [Paenarthrobacter ureafaciens]|uniref:hypothetical protein n=1 Tax=Paenarthrobacter ureafaciens TaxID=37931 RepID=UPI003464CEA9
MNRHRRSDRVSMGGWNRILVVALGILLVSWSGPAASAFWSSVSSNGAAAKSDALAQGSKPSTSVTGTNVSVTWAASTTAAGRSVTGYSIARYGSANGGTGVPATGGCAGTVTSLACVDADVPAGTWYYTVTPMLALWQGQESARSVGNLVDTTAPDAPSLTVPAYVNRETANKVPVDVSAESGSSVTLTVTGTGAAPMTRTITSATSTPTTVVLDLSGFSDGTLSFSAQATDAAGNTGPAGAATSFKDIVVPTVTGVQLVNGGGSSGIGKIEPNDSVVISFSEPLSGASICSSWTESENSKTLSGLTVNVSSGNELTVSGAACPTFRFGKVALGGTYYHSGTLSYSGSSLEWNPATKKLSVTLGATVTGSPKNGSQTAGVANFAPAPGLTDAAGNPVASGSATWATSRF